MPRNLQKQQKFTDWVLHTDRDMEKFQATKLEHSGIKTDMYQ